MNRNNDKRVPTIIVLSILLALYLSYVTTRNDYYRKKLPAGIQPGRVVAIDSEIGGFTGGCGYAVFEIVHDTSDADQIKTTDTGSKNDEFEYAGWQKTPYVETGDGLTLEDRWTGGLSCANPNKELARTINGALIMPGSYYMKLGLAGVVLVPSAGIVAYIYFD